MHLPDRWGTLSVEQNTGQLYNKHGLRRGVMKHAEASLLTKKALADALKSAMIQKPFSKITVSELIAACDINRKTFYYHFDDIYALLKWMFEQEAIDVVRQFDLLINYEEAIEFVMDYVEKNNYIISCAYNAIGRDEMKRFFYADFIGVISSVIESAEAKASAKLDPDFKEFLARFYAEAIAGMLIEWVQEKNHRDRGKTTKYLSAILEKSIDVVERMGGES